MPRFDGRFFPSSTVSDWAAGKFGTPGWYPAAPTGVTPTEGDQQIALTWTEGNTHGADITGYKVEKNDGSWSTVTSDTGSGTASYTVTGLTNATAYTFRVTAINGVGVGEAPSSVSASTTPRGVPGAPGTLSLALGSPAATVINLSWSAGSTNGGAITGYKIQRSTNGSSWSNVVADTGSTGTTYSNTGLTGSTAYYYRVAAINVAGTGGYGNEPTLTTAAPFVIYSTTGSPTIRTHGIYTSIHWTGAGTFSISSNPNSRTFDIWAVAGGGGSAGGYNGYGPGGGGGAGGAKAFTGYTLANGGGQGASGTYNVVVGAGGAGAANATGVPGSKGSDSSFDLGGGSSEAEVDGGGFAGVQPGGDGGSGGGGHGNGGGVPGDGIAGQGNDGGSGYWTGWAGRAGAGGGKGGAGGNHSASGHAVGGVKGTNHYATGSGSTWGQNYFSEGGDGGYGSTTGDHGGSGAGDGSGGGGGGQSSGGQTGNSGCVVVRWVT
jgi:hypothetical protein